MRKILPPAPDEGMEMIINLEMEELPQREISAAPTVYSILGSIHFSKIVNFAEQKEFNPSDKLDFFAQT